MSPIADNQPLSVVFASDNNGCLPLGIAMYSLLESAAPGTTCHIYILDDGISDLNRRHILALREQFDTEIAFIPITEILKPFRRLSRHYLPAATYARLHLPSLLPESVDRVLYADIDVLFCKDLREVIEMDMKGAALGVVYEQVNRADLDEIKIRLGMEADTYFNAGVILFNLQEMRKMDIEPVLFDYFTEHVAHLYCADQDVLNAVFQHSTVRLHPRWNWTDGYSRRLLFKSAHAEHWGSGTRREVLEAAHDPGILHFWGKHKPWFHNFRYEGERYRQVWLRSPWKDQPMQKYSVKTAIRKMTMAPVYALTRYKIKKLLRQEINSEPK